MSKKAYHLRQINTTKKPSQPVRSVATLPLSTSSPVAIQSSTTSSTTCTCSVCVKLGPKPAPVSGKEWIVTWSLIDKASTSTPSPSNRSSEEIMLNKLKGLVRKNSARKRQKIDFKARTVLNKESLRKIQRKKEKEDRTKKRHSALKMKKKSDESTQSTRRRHISSSSDDSGDEGNTEGECG